MSEKKEKDQGNFISLQSLTPTFCGFPLNIKNINRMWRWDTLEEIKTEENNGNRNQENNKKIQ